MSKFFDLNGVATGDIYALSLVTRNGLGAREKKRSLFTHKDATYTHYE